MTRHDYWEDDVENSHDNEINNYYNQDESDNYISEDDAEPSPNILIDMADETKNENQCIQYNLLTIGITNLIVSNHGSIRKSSDIFSSSMGYALPGTPYRTYVVEIEKDVFEEYFVHDLIWRAFHGNPPEGWEVRHSFWEPKNGNEFYNNSLNYLHIYPSTVVYMPSMRNNLPTAD